MPAANFRSSFVSGVSRSKTSGVERIPRPDTLICVAEALSIEPVKFVKLESLRMLRVSMFFDSSPLTTWFGSAGSVSCGSVTARTSERSAPSPVKPSM